jgi:flagellar protein FliJ
MSFRFRLATLLRLRLADRDQRRADLAKAQRAEDALRIQAASVAREQDELNRLSRKLASPGEAEVDRLIAARRYELVLRAKAGQLSDQIEQVKAEVERRRAVLIESDRQVRVLEGLREKQQAAYQMAEERSEQKLLDEQAAIAFVRKEVLA